MNKKAREMVESVKEIAFALRQEVGSDANLLLAATQIAVESTNQSLTSEAIQAFRNMGDELFDQQADFERRVSDWVGLPEEDGGDDDDDGGQLPDVLELKVVGE